MTDEILITTDAAGVADFRSIRQQHSEQPATRHVSTPAAGSAAIVVEIRTVIDDDAYVTVPQVKLKNGQWEKVRDRSVRRIGSGSILGSTDDPVRMVATRVASLGLVVRTSE